MAVTFIYSSTVVQLQNPQRGNRYERKILHALGRTAGGQLYRYTKGVALKRLVLEFNEIRNDEKAAFESFFFTTVTGPSTDFTYTDHAGTVWNARFLQDAVDFEEIADETLNAISFPVGAAWYPTTIRKNPIWKFAIEIEVW